MSRERLRIRVTGAVQGVGFRPLVHRLAGELELGGFVRNHGALLEIEAEGECPGRLAEALRQAPPTGAVVERVTCAALAARGDREFRIAPSVCETAGATSPRLLADRACCADCVRDVFDPASRFHRYPFTNCSHCGPRYSIQLAVPYDRARTTMATFVMCVACRAEYLDPADRRFHAQPIACPACGPSLLFERSGGADPVRREAALLAATSLVVAGGILALKGLGGYQVIADARDPVALGRLRERKARPAKPFAIMVRDLAEARRYCRVSAAEAELLASPAAPIVLLERAGGGFPDALAPGLGTLGVMLPTTPLHHLLLRALPGPVVCTSGNRAEEPIAFEDADARERLAGIADGWLAHDRPIRRPLDDSVARIIDGGPQVLRVGRGYAPVTLPYRAAPAVFGAGGQLKNTLALATGGRIVVSQHLGDLDDARCLDGMHNAAADLLALHGVEPTLAAVDAHPDYAATSSGPALRWPRRSVQHHLAHALAVMLEHELEGPLLAVVWDGSGLGSDATLWGGEFLRIERRADVRWTRAGHLRPFPLPGGDAAAREPERALSGALWQIPELRQRVARGHRGLLERGLNAPFTTSVGRLFDAVAALAGFRGSRRYEGEAAMWLEHAAAAHPDAQPYPLPVTEGVLDWAPLLRAAVADADLGASAACIGARFHAALAGAIVTQAQRTGLDTVILTGGCFQNRLLTERAMAELRAAGFSPVIARRLPPHDGALAAGQVVAAVEGEIC
jgi:hydrogenase maturation protein HypF